jgi:cobalt/nickel transport system ATP-binding protein
LVVTRAVEVEDLTFHFADGTTALRGVSFAVDEGECVALVGPNGAGKSTLLLHLNGVLPEEPAEHSAGTVRVLGRELTPSSAAWVRRQVGVLFQDPDDQLFCPTVGEDVAFGPEQLGLPAHEIETRVRSSLARVGLAGFERRMPHRLSGGEKKRVCLAGLLAYEPKILVLDEPTSGLDPRGRRELIELLACLPTTRIIATHDLAMAARLCSRALLVYDGKIVAERATGDLFLDDALMAAHGMECPSRDLPPGLIRGSAGSTP